MPIMRNPFRKNPADQVPSENEGSRRSSLSASPLSFESQPLSVRANGLDKEPVEYKLSEINDSGVYLPPSPTEKTSFWSMRSTSSTNTHRSAITDNDAFTISRESFDSYRRSFDICARSPVLSADVHRPRQSLDVRAARLPSAAAVPLRDNHFHLPESQPEDRFEEIGLNDEAPKPKKHGFMARFAGSSTPQHSSTASADPNSRPSSSHYGLNMFGRKRGASGQGQELGAVPSAKPQAYDVTAE